MTSATSGMNGVLHADSDRADQPRADPARAIGRVEQVAALSD